MATTDELLESAEEDETEDTTEYIVVDSEARTLTVPSAEAVFGVFSDYTVERKYFLCPRYVVSEKMDMLESVVKVNYVSSGGNIGTYTCEDVEAYDDDNVSFSWVLDSSVFDGNKNTTISFAVKATDGTNVFNTQKATGTVYETIEVETLYSQYAALLLQIIAMIDPDIDATDDDAIVAGIKNIIDTAEASTASGETTIIDQLNALIEGYWRGETITVVDLDSVEVYVGDYADSDTLSVDSGAVNIYGRYITT